MSNLEICKTIHSDAEQKGTTCRISVFKFCAFCFLQIVGRSDRFNENKETMETTREKTQCNPASPKVPWTQSRSTRASHMSTRT